MIRAARTISRTLSLAVMAATWLAGPGCCRTPPPQRPCAASLLDPVTVELTGGDDRAATKKLAAFLKDHGFTIVTLEESAIGVRYHGIGAILLPKLDGGRGIDRLVVTRLYAPKKEHRGKPEIVELAQKLNQKLNIANFWVHEDGSLMVTTQMTFVDQLRLAWIAAFFDWLSGQAAQIATIVPEARTLLE
jgi:hypothetical protein